MLKRYLFTLLLALLLASWVAHAQAPVITGVSPGRNAGAAPRGANVAITFSQALQNKAATCGAVRVFNQQRSGLWRDGAQATVSGCTLTLDPATDFKPGETLLVSTTPWAMASGGTMAHGQVYQFTNATSGTGRGNCLPGAELTGDFSTSVVLGDVDGDGDLDQVATNVLNLTVSVRLNGGDATGSNTGIFSGSSDLPMMPGSYPAGVSLGDTDDDGDLDLLAANTGTTTVSVFLNGGDATGSGTGVFSGGSTVGVGSNLRNIAAGERHRPRSSKDLPQVSKHWHQWLQSVSYI